MEERGQTIGRRRWLASAGALAFGLAAERALGRTITPAQTTGPFYPYDPALESDADLTQVEGHPTRAKGVIAHLSGTVTDRDGRAVRNADVEIWQCDANGRYHHPRDWGMRAPDPGFQGHGRTRTGNDGAYRFRTIRPVPYPGRAPHIHVAVAGHGFERLTTQLYVEGAPENAHDVLLNAIESRAQRARLVVAFAPHPVRTDERTAHFDIVLG